MFVSPPPPTNSNHILPGLLSRGRPRELGVIDEEGSSSGGSSGGGREVVGGLSINGVGIGGGRKKQFINAPSEYADRARDEIRKRLLHKKAGAVSDAADGGRAPSDQQSIISSVTSGHVSLFSQQTEDTVPSMDSTQDERVKGGRQVLLLEDALPKVFYDMYAPEILMNPQNLFSNGRPTFTSRELLDWDLNDIRSLLIVEQLRPEWGNQLPIIQLPGGTQGEMPQFRFQLLQLDSPDETIIDTLVTSDIYMEANLDYEFKLTGARYTVAAARKRHEQVTGRNEEVMRLSKPEWRNIIENYLLNLAVEAQCRFDFRNSCRSYKRWKQQHLIKKPDMPPPSTIPSKHNRSTSLLKRALLKGTYQHQQESANQNVKVVLTKEEKAQLWSHCQAVVYQRLGLDWTPDGM
ncbi:Std1p Ecym_5487 [Eremothecium cymbalariae DBVPG|uniref:Uncharacterized protein n=1 Tax=Eremothecium cymbalariae (strain CBS 270.75 / DBVPG 7215 / KCTC 17166 / NRRL Y-17582) TaxID=931890 RepID=I6NDU0_ERECY|nr:hypothetical protein Ecym_5487 [Eremothecium cymbalariae DBVPG\